TSGDGQQSVATVTIASVAPGVFVLNGGNLAAAVGLLFTPDGSYAAESVYAVDGNGNVVAKALNLGPASDQFVLSLYGTGLRAAGTGGVSVTVNDVAVTVQYAGAQGGFQGLDQVNVLLPQSLAGKGSVTIRLTAGGISANPTNVTIQ